MKPCQPSAQAEADIDRAVDYYLAEAAPEVAARLLDSYQDALSHIARFPRTGSRRYGGGTVNVELRFWLLDKFPYAVFYIERETIIEVVRVLHQAQDIPAHLQN